MNPAITAEDLWPIVQKLPRDELIRLLQFAVRAANVEPGTGVGYQTSPPAETEFSADQDGLAWEGDGWEEFYAPR